jgi:hypothetical protein
MQGAIDLLESERGIFCIAILIAVTALAILKVITGAAWLDFAKWLTVTLVTCKTVSHAVETLHPAESTP